MLRITVVEGVGAPSLVLEGSVSGPWVEVLRTAVAACRPDVELDLSQVRFVDADGAALLRLMVSQRVRIRRCSAFVASLLGQTPRDAR